MTKEQLEAAQKKQAEINKFHEVIANLERDKRKALADWEKKEDAPHGLAIIHGRFAVGFGDGPVDIPRLSTVPQKVVIEFTEEIFTRLIKWHKTRVAELEKEFRDL